MIFSKILEFTKIIANPYENPNIQYSEIGVFTAILIISVITENWT